jgi:uracil-DNA glycosylase
MSMNDLLPYEQDNALQELCRDISICRDSQCPVVQQHPFYPIPHQPPLYYDKRPCLPVVPTHLAKGQVMIVGEYPNCRFASVLNPENGQVKSNVPVGDINEPFEGGRYFNGRQVQVYPTAQSLHENYLAPLSLDLQTNVWLTNVVKCFLMKKQHIDIYKDLGWIGAGRPKTGASYEDFEDYFAIAARCVQQHLARELEVCQPRLVIGLGEHTYRLMHSSDDLQTPGPDLAPFTQITGVPLRAGIVSHDLDERNSLFKDLNVIHLFHPSLMLYDPPARNRHLAEDIPPTRQFIQELSL